MSAPQLHTTKRNLARRVREHWVRATDDILACGRVLLEAKDLLDHGDFTSWIDEALPFSSRTAQCLMSIASNDWIAKTATSAVLPPAWGTLYELSRLPPEELDRALAAGLVRADMALGEARALRRALPAPAPAVPLAEAAGEKRYAAILADPPWPFESWGAGNDRSPERHYPTMSIAEICALPVRALAAPDSALFLWVQANAAREAIQVIGSWGFDFKTVAFIWVKEGNYGTGYWTRQRAEACLLATKGRPPRLNGDVDQVVIAPRGRHSEKPEEIAKRIERLVGGPYIELFARTRRPGWDAWGNEVPPCP